MAQLAVTAGGALAGGAIGSFFPGVGTLFGAKIGALAGAIIGGIFFPGGGPTGQGPTVGDLRVQAASYSRPMPLLAGTIRVAGTVIAMSNLIPTPVETSVGGGLGGATVVSGYTYSITMAVSFGRPLLGPATGITRLWADGKLLFDNRPGHKFIAASTLYGSARRFYMGSNTQLPDPWIQAHFGAAVASAYRGQVYMVIENLQLANLANHPPNFTAEVVCNGTAAYPYSVANPEVGANFDDSLTINSDLGIIVDLDFEGNVSVVDTATHEIDAGPTQVFAGSGSVTPALVFGSDGYLYGSGEGPGGANDNFRKWSKVDPSSLAIVQQIGYDDIFDGSYHDGLGIATYLKCRGYPYILGCLGTAPPASRRLARRSSRRGRSKRC